MFQGNKVLDALGAFAERKLSIKGKPKEASEDLLDGKGSKVPGYQPSGPVYRPKFGDNVRRSAEDMLTGWRAKQGNVTAVAALHQSKHILVLLCCAVLPYLCSCHSLLTEPYLLKEG